MKESVNQAEEGEAMDRGRATMIEGPLQILDLRKALTEYR